MNKFKQIAKILFRIAIVCLITLVLFELSYRFQWVDFYKVEWTFLNKEKHLNKKKGEKVLVFGDSFSSDSQSWVNQWQDSNSSYIVHNASMPGVGVEVYDIIFNSRIEEVNPDVVIVQLYMGNDLYDINKPVRWGKFSFQRNLFWTFSNHLRGLNFINYRLGQISTDIDLNYNPKANDAFDKENYDTRSKLYIKNISHHPSNVVLLEKEFENDFNQMINKLNSMKNRFAGKKFFVLVVPHCIQVHENYIEMYSELGADIHPNVKSENKWTIRLKEEGFDVIDPTINFREVEEVEGGLYYQNDPHLNKKGQSVLLNNVLKEMNSGDSFSDAHLHFTNMDIF